MPTPHARQSTHCLSEWPHSAAPSTCPRWAYQNGSGVVMLAFTLDPGRWWIARPLGRNPLLRAADRLEALLILVVIVGWLLVVPIAGAVGTAIYDGRHRLYAEQALTRHRVVATVVEGTATTAGRCSAPASVQAGWTAAGEEGIGSLSFDTAGKSVDPLQHLGRRRRKLRASADFDNAGGARCALRCTINTFVGHGGNRIGADPDAVVSGPHARHPMGT